MQGRSIGRREFLATAGAAGAALLTGCGGQQRAATGAVRTATAPRNPTRRPRVVRHVPRLLRDAIRGQVLDHGSPGFAEAAHVYNERFDWVIPNAVARPVDAEDVRAAVRWALGSGVSVRARSGGHSYAGYSTLSDGVVLDLRKLSAIDVDRTAGVAYIGPGAQLIDIYGALASSGATLPAGSCPSVGLGGMAMGGGMGLAGRAFGLTVDHVVGAQLVTADGELHDVDATHDPDLLWAIRGGGGGNFGVVTRFTLRLEEIPAASSYFVLSWPWEAASEVIDAWLRWAPAADDRLTSILHLSAAPGTTTVGVSGQFLGPSTTLRNGLLGAMSAVPGVSLDTGDEDYLTLQRRWAGCLDTSPAVCHTAGAAPGGTLARASFYAKSDYVGRPFSQQARAVLTAAIETRAGLPGSGAVLFDSYGGAINRVSPGATAFVHRNELCAIQYLSYGGGAAWLEQTWGAMRPYVSGQAYQNYIDPALPDWRQAYYAGNLPRLVAIRERVDPDRFFRFPQGI